MIVSSRPHVQLGSVSPPRSAKRRSVYAIRPRRSPAIVTAKKKTNLSSDVLDSIQRLCETVQEQLSGLRSELVEIKTYEESQGQRKETIEVDVAPVSDTSSMERALKQILDRQERFFKEEREYWMEERAEWRKHEAELRSEIARLQGLLGEPPRNESTRLSVKPDDTEPSKKESKPDDTASSKKESVPKTNKIEIITSDLQDIVAKPKVNKAETTGIGIKESIAAAMSLVDKMDVLSDGFDHVLKQTTNGKSIPVSQKQSVDKERQTLETAKGPPTGPPPTLVQGDDDIYWVSQLHEALSQKGFYCGDDDVEDFFFGDGTTSALLTFQACQVMKETGITDAATWRELLGPDLKPVIGSVESDMSPKQENTPTEKAQQTDSFPVLSELDGGKEVHCLQVMLEIAGYSCGKDDMQWWQYGDDTIAAVKTFQACNGLPQSGVADEKTWELLIGRGKTMVDVMDRVEKENIFQEDLSNTDRVWLLGEQRWERKL